MHPEKDALHESQPVIFAIGAGTWVFPVLTKTVAMFRSPLTNELGESYAGGRLAMTMLMAGYDAIVLVGKSPKPVYLQVSNHDVQLKDARALWGLNSEDTGRTVRERETGGGKRSIIRIGPAGENKVSFASVLRRFLSPFRPPRPGRGPRQQKPEGDDRDRRPLDSYPGYEELF